MMSNDPRTTFFVAPLKTDGREVIQGARIMRIEATSFLDAARQVGETDRPMGISSHPDASGDWKSIAELLNVS